MSDADKEKQIEEDINAVEVAFNNIRFAMAEFQQSNIEETDVFLQTYQLLALRDALAKGAMVLDQVINNAINR